MATANLDRRFLNHTQCVQAIVHAGEFVTPVIKGEPGSGKSSMLRSVAEEFGDQWRNTGDYFPTDKYCYIYFDCSTKDVGDVVMQIPDMQTKALEGIVSSVFLFDDPRPKVIMLDEIMKCPKMMQVMFMRLILERCVGDRPLAKGSIVFATSNNESDNVGDAMLAHGINRIMEINYAKPDATETNVHFSNIGVSALTRAWIALNQRVCFSYLTCDAEELRSNPFIFNPAKKGAYCSNRSMHKADTVVVKHLDKLGDTMSEAMLAGLCGVAAAQSMMTFFKMAKDLQSVKTIFKDPDGTPMVEKDGALVMMMFNAIDEAQSNTDLSAFVNYLKRKGSNMFLAMFFTMALSTKRTQRFARNNPEILEWSRVPGNYQLLI